METYSQYRIEDFYERHGWQGGLTVSQIQSLYHYAIKRKGEEYKFLALIHGVNLDSSGDSQQQSQQQQPQNQSLPIFGDPEKDYAHLSAEEKEKETEKMMRQHRGWAQQAIGKTNG